MVGFLPMLWYVSVYVTYTAGPTDPLQGFSSRYLYDFTEMNDALLNHRSHLSFHPYGSTSGSRTQAKVQQIRGDDGRS